MITKLLRRIVCNLIERTESFLFKIYLFVSKGSFLNFFSSEFRGVKNIYVGKNCEFGKNIFIAALAGNKIRIENDVIIHPFVKIRTCGGDIHIKKGTVIHSFCVLYGYKGIKIGERCGIATSTIIVGGNHEFDNSKKSIWDQDKNGKGVVIGNEVWIGSGARILDGSIIEEGCVIGAGSIVTKAIPRNGVVYGDAAKLRYLRDEKL